jgi:hypothetical protein
MYRNEKKTKTKHEKKNSPECETEVPLLKLPKRRDLKGKEVKTLERRKK